MCSVSEIKFSHSLGSRYIKLKDKHYLFLYIMNLTLTFDPMTFTLNQCVAFINVNPHTKFGFNPTNST